MIRTRFAPSPTGYMHIGNLRSALYAYLFARRHNGVFLLRIEDTDQGRLVEGAIDVIYDTLKRVGITWDEGPDIGGDFGPYVQSERKALYMPLAKSLIEKGHAYRCFCTKEVLEKKRAEAALKNETFKYDKHCLKLKKSEIDELLASNTPFVVRQNIPLQGITTFTDMLFGSISVENSTLDDNVLIKADGMPTYNFANVVDDHLMAITHVMRGMEYLSSAPKYNLLYEAFGWEIPAYIHMPPIMKDASHKLSKRTGDASFQDLEEKGYLAEAILNYIALLGWNPGDEREVFTLKELEEVFDVSGMSKSPAIFDPVKLTWLNAAYIRNLTKEQFSFYSRPYYLKAGVSNLDEGMLFRILQQRVEYFSQIPDMVDFLADLDENYSIELFTNKKSKTDSAISKTVLELVIKELEALNNWAEEELHSLFAELALRLDCKKGTLLWPIRIALAGKAVTPGGAIEIALLLGRKESLRRLNTGRKKLEL